MHSSMNWNVKKKSGIHPAILIVSGLIIIVSVIAVKLLMSNIKNTGATESHVGTSDYTSIAAPDSSISPSNDFSSSPEDTEFSSSSSKSTTGGVSLPGRISRSTLTQALRSAPPAERMQIAKDFLTEGMFQKTSIDPETGDELVYLDEQDIANGAQALVALTTASFSTSSSGTSESLASVSNSNQSSGASIESILEGLGSEATTAILKTAIQNAQIDGGVGAAFALVQSIRNSDLRQDATQVLAGELLASRSFDETSQLFQDHFNWPKANADGVVAVKAHQMANSNFLQE